MRFSTILKSGLGLIYTSIIIAAIYFVLVWVTQYIVNFTWTGAILFWLIGLPIMIGLFQAIASIAAMPVVYLMKGSKGVSWLLILPASFFLFSFGTFLWTVASSVGGILIWLLLISWFSEVVWLFVAYFMVAISSAYNSEDTTSTVS